MARSEESIDIRRELVELLLSKVDGDRYPSVTQMNMLEDLISPDERPIYARILMDKIQRDYRAVYRFNT